MSPSPTSSAESKYSRLFCLTILITTFVVVGVFLTWYNANPERESVLLLSVTFTFFIGVKSIVRWCVMNIGISSLDVRNKCMFLSEHVIFSVWAYYEIVIAPENTGSNSWLLHPTLNWTYPKIPSETFHLFIITKTATHVEDLLYIAAVFLNELSKGNSRDLMMDVHHIITAVLCISSYVTGYVKIGSLVMLIHDVSDIPLDLLRICVTLNYKTSQIVFFVLTLIMWAYWRLYLLPSVVLRTIVYDARSFLVNCIPTVASDCFYEYLPEKVFFIAAIGTLLVLHFIWYYKMLQKGYRELVLGEKKIKKKTSNAELSAAAATAQK